MKHYVLVINIEVLQASGFVSAKHFHPSLIFANKARQELTRVETLIGQKVDQIENESKNHLAIEQLSKFSFVS